MTSINNNSHYRRSLAGIFLFKGDIVALRIKLYKAVYEATSNGLYELFCNYVTEKDTHTQTHYFQKRMTANSRPQRVRTSSVWDGKYVHISRLS